MIIKTQNYGFTLLEMLVVMTIIAILAAGIWGNFFSSLFKGRDSRRKQDLQAISKAVEMYFNDTRSYPNPTLVSNWGQPFLNPNNPSVIYLQQIPADPNYPGITYCYESSDGTYYKLYARLENVSDNDPKKLSPQVVCANGYYNYGLSSMNTTP